MTHDKLIIAMNGKASNHQFSLARGLFFKISEQNVDKKQESVSYIT